MNPRLVMSAAAFAVVLGACGASDGTEPAGAGDTAVTVAAPASEPAPESDTDSDAGDTAPGTAAADDTTEATAESGTTAGAATGESLTLRADVWADNWFGLWINGELVGEDSVPITTERSFNAESFTFEATLPLTVAVEAKDFKENDTGLEYIGTDRQQMGDGGLIVQIVDVGTGEVVAVSSGEWQALVTHIAPLDKACEGSIDPDADCGFATADVPDGWTGVGFDASGWQAASVWTAGDVGPKDGYDEIGWDPAAQFIWGTDLETDNTVLLRTVTG